MSRRDRGADPDAAERLRSVRERLEATVSGLGELDFLRQRQEVLVRTALELREAEGEAEKRREVELSSEEKLLQENILLLRKQLNCLRRRDAGLITQLQELDQQICDLRLDTDGWDEPQETDSRPSSGFYELSDAASGSLSNSSNSVFSECFCSVPDADGRLPPTDEPLGCLECDALLGGRCDDSSSSATVRRSLSAPHPPTLDSCDPQTKFHYDLVARNGSDVYRYPSPLHAVAVQSPAFRQTLAHAHSRDEGFVKSIEAVAEADAPAPPGPLVSQSSSWPAPSLSSLAPPLKHLDSYIYSLLQRRALPVRTSRPRTSISTDPSKSTLRQAGLCARQVSGPSSGCGPGPLAGSEPKLSWPTGGASAEEAATSLERKCEEQQMPNAPARGSGDLQTGFKTNSSDLTTKQNSSPPCAGIQKEGSGTSRDSSLLKKTQKGPVPHVAASTAALPQLGSPRAKSTPTCVPPDQELLLDPSLPQSSERPAAERTPSQSPEEGEPRSRLQTQNTKPRKTGNVQTSRASEPGEPTLGGRREKSHHGSSSRKSSLLDKVSKRGTGGAPGASSTKIRRLPASVPEGRVLDRQTTSTLHTTRSGAFRHHHGNHHHHGREQVVVVAKPKHKRSDYRRLRALTEVPCDEALRRARRRRRKDPLSRPAANTCRPSGGQMSSPYAYVAASDSEYSAECASLFHSTIMDTSEDEKSNYTTNRFGDSESSMDEYVEESTTTSDTEESGGGGGGGRSRAWNQLGPAEARATGQEMSPAQAKAFVKIKASHSLKRKILRFRSGSLKLMTTV